MIDTMNPLVRTQSDAESGVPTSGVSERHWRPVWLFLCLSGVLWLAAALGSHYWRSIGSTDPNQWLLLISAEPYRDFTIYSGAFTHFHTIQFFSRDLIWPFTYPAAAALIYAFFYLLFAHPLKAFLSVAISVPIFASLLFSLALARKGLAVYLAVPLGLITLLMSYPFWFEWQRGNIEVVLWAVLAIAFFSYIRRAYALAAFLFGIAIAIKIYPFIFLGLLLAKKKYWQTALAAVTAFLVNDISLRVVGPTYAAARTGIANGLEFFRQTYLIESSSNGFDHSLMGLFKSFLFLPGPSPIHRNELLLTMYMAIMAVGGLLLYLFRIYRLPDTNRIASLVVISVLIPPVSYDYTLIHLYFAWAALVLYLANGGKASRSVIYIFALLAIVMSPEGYLYYMNVRVAGQLKCVALVGVLYLLLRHPLTSENAEGEKPHLLSRNIRLPV